MHAYMVLSNLMCSFMCSKASAWYRRHDGMLDFAGTNVLLESYFCCCNKMHSAKTYLLLFLVLEWLMWHGALLLMLDENIHVICCFDVVLKENLSYCI
jgi:hypothetical protein